MGYMELGSSPVSLSIVGRTTAPKAMDDIPALFNPKLEFYNIPAFMIMNFIEIF